MSFLLSRGSRNGSGRISAAVILVSALLLPTSHAQFTAIPLTPESFNHDIVVERTAPRPVRPVTTASVEAGLGNTGFS